MIVPVLFAKCRCQHQGLDLLTFRCSSTTTETNLSSTTSPKSLENTPKRMIQWAFWDTLPKKSWSMTCLRRIQTKIFLKFRAIRRFYIIFRHILWHHLRKSVETRIILPITLCICTNWIRMTRLKNWTMSYPRRISWWRPRNQKTDPKTWCLKASILTLPRLNSLLFKYPLMNSRPTSTTSSPMKPLLICYLEDPQQKFPPFHCRQLLQKINLIW